MKIFASNKLTHTLQTYLGMVEYDGWPQPRSLPRLPKSFCDNERVKVTQNEPRCLSEEALALLFSSCVLGCRLPQFRSTDADTRRLEANIYACCDSHVDIGFLKRNVVARKRLDLEQAAAVVISTIRNDTSISHRAEIVTDLVKELDHTLLTQSCMWLEGWDSGNTVEEARLARVVGLLQRMLDRRLQASLAGASTNWSSLLPLLLRVRRSSPRSRCLFIPQWIFDAAGMKPHPERAIWDTRGCVKPGHEPMTRSPPNSDDIILSRKEFRSLQRRLLRQYRFWDPEIRLRKAIADLEADIVYGAELIKSTVLPSQNTLIVAHYFFALQRRLQRKVVSDVRWTRFLEKGESGNILQNNPEIPTTFEQCLSRFSGQTGVSVTGLLLPQIDQCCVLMEHYVNVYGDGDRNNLVFVRGSRGGSGRGAVDDYNLLCDILKTLCKAAREQGLAHPEPVRKFLAKDIMAWNRSFDDDAFANGRVPGWETWLAQRRGAGLLPSMENLKLSEPVEVSD